MATHLRTFNVYTICSVLGYKFRFDTSKISPKNVDTSFQKINKYKNYYILLVNTEKVKNHLLKAKNLVERSVFVIVVRTLYF